MKTPYYNVPNLQKIADLEAEIERLKEDIQWMKKSWTNEVASKVAEIELLKALLEECASALEESGCLIMSREAREASK